MIVQTTQDIIILGVELKKGAILNTNGMVGHQPSVFEESDKEPAYEIVKKDGTTLSVEKTKEDKVIETKEQVKEEVKQKQKK